MMCLNMLQCELWPGGGAGWMLTGAGLTTGSTVVCRGWMTIVLACREAAAGASGTAVISGFGWMETLGPIWIGLLIGWAGLAGVCVRGWEWKQWDKKTGLNTRTSWVQVMEFELQLQCMFKKPCFFLMTTIIFLCFLDHIPDFWKPRVWCRISRGF